MNGSKPLIEDIEDCILHNKPIPDHYIDWLKDSSIYEIYHIFKSITNYNRYEYFKYFKQYFPKLSQMDQLYFIVNNRYLIDIDDMIDISKIDSKTFMYIVSLYDRKNSIESVINNLEKIILPKFIDKGVLDNIDKKYIIDMISIFYHNDSKEETTEFFYNLNELFINRYKNVNSDKDKFIILKTLKKIKELYYEYNIDISRKIE